MDREKKYDRQLRLWATDGQSSLEQSHVCLINATSTGCEVLKNLVLPGCGRFTIIDNQKVTERDLSSNFFLEEKDLGRSRSEAACEILAELNSDVYGISETTQLQELLVDSAYWDQFSVVVINRIVGSEYSALSDVLWSKNIPLLEVEVNGFYGYLKLSAPEVTVVETHPESLVDLRIDVPWKELQEYSDSIILNDLDETDHAHVPYSILLIKFLQLWKHEYGKPPSNYQEKKKFKELIGAFDKGSELNFEEAISFSWKAAQVSNVPSYIAEILEDPKTEKVDLSTPLFWVYMKGLKNFLQSDQSGGLLPLSGVLPDMASDTKNYVNLQILYRKKAKGDREQFITEVRTILSEIGRSEDEISEAAAEIFCKNCRFLYVQRGSRHVLSESHIRNMKNEELSFGIYLGFLACSEFFSLFKRYPAEGDHQEVVKLSNSIIKRFSPSSEELSSTLIDIINQFCLSEGSEIHNIASFMGGICGQEALKLITGQYRPLDNTMIFNGIESTTEKWKF